MLPDSSNGFDETKHLYRRDVSLHDEFMIAHFKWSKHDSLGIRETYQFSPFPVPHYVRLKHFYGSR